MSPFIKARAYFARKRCFCALCGYVIRIGERYNYVVGRDEGRFFCQHEHIDCTHRAMCPNYAREHPEEAAGR